MKRSATALWLFLAWSVFVVYGSLVPLEFKALPLGVAWDRFQHIPFLKLGLESRADWVANGVLYLPVGFLAVRALTVAGIQMALAACVACAFGCALAVGVEFTQLFFPGRTVSQNDILAECIGCVLGALTAPFFAGWLDRLAAAWRSGGARLLPRLLELYAVAYVLLSFFPYDLLLSAAEIHDKWQSKSWGWLFAPNDRGLFFTGLQWSVELALVMPLGAMRMFHRPAGDARQGEARVGLALLTGALLGLSIECGQFFVATAVSQGASIISRALGLAAGAVCVRWLQQAGFEGLRAALRPLAPWLWLPYLPLLAAVNGFFKLHWQGAAHAVGSLQTTHWLPFYYHYFTTEALALFSLTNVTLLYLPVAVLTWARGGSARTAALIAALLAAFAETAKLFMTGAHADPTNVLVAAGTNAAAMALAALAQRQHLSGNGPAAGLTFPAAAEVPAAPAAAPWLLAVPALTLVALAAVAAALFPAFPVLLLCLLMACVALVWRWPVLVLAIVPAALPVLDWAPWSGRFFIDEFDLLQLACLAVALHRTQAMALQAARQPRRFGVTLVFALLGLSLSASALRSWLALPSLGDSNFSSYYSPYNALRIVKGAVWAWLFVTVWQRLAALGEKRAQTLSAGVALGLALTVFFVLWERAVFGGLLDFTADFRVTGPFSAMHKGGAYIECYLAVASAFVVATVLRPGPVALRAGALLLLGGAGYAMLVTYSRNGYAALAAVLLVSLLAVVPTWLAARADRLSGQPRAASPWTQVAFAVALLMVVAAVAVPLAGGYARQRLSQSGKDLGLREAHWADGLALRDSSAVTALIGMGVGRFPERHFWGSLEAQRAAAYSLGRDADVRHLRLAQGATLYIEQIVPSPQFAALKLSFDWRGAAGQSAPVAVLCEKWTLTSLNCAQAGPVAPMPGVSGDAALAASAAKSAPAWQHAETNIDASRLLAAAKPWPAPFKLALMTPKAGSFDITRVRLTSPLGEELLVNGDFSQGMDHWFFATDVDPPWHLHSLPVAVLFDQGWLGVLAWCAVALAALGSGTVLLWRNQAQVPAAAVAVLGFAVSGSLNTLIDAPRFLWLLLVLLWLATASTVAAKDRLVHPPGSRTRSRQSARADGVVGAP
jgi:VanZ family protein